ncbi:hypothetical protein FRC12_010614 [Ceratobasidium sp. 428]|nr:hypothetical protein FRC12_010614 [Ceratobasidium sp. 428]
MTRLHACSPGAAPTTITLAPHLNVAPLSQTAPVFLLVLVPATLMSTLCDRRVFALVVVAIAGGD